MNRIRRGKTASPTKHLGKSVGSSRNTNLKKIANKMIRQEGKTMVSQNVIS